MSRKLQALTFNGVHSGSLGGYLVGLGLLSACSKRWPDIRGCWRNGYFILLHQNIEISTINDFLLNCWVMPTYPVIEGKTPKPIWADKQKSDTKYKISDNISKFRSECSLGEIQFLDSHIISIERNIFNPIFGSGGNVGRRNFAKVGLEAKEMINEAEESIKSLWLDNTLFGIDTNLPELKATGTWFVHANRTYNSGQANIFREGKLSPWSFLLALEGSLLFVGSVEKRLTNTARAYATFPFIASPGNPSNEKSSRVRREGEFWAPLWETPATIIEISGLLHRGLARLGQKNASSPHEFGIAVLNHGVDAGVSGFAPFELRETTTSQVFEAIPKDIVHVQENDWNRTAAELILELAPWINRLPGERKKEKGFLGLRGPIEESIQRVSEDPVDSSLWQELLLRVADTQKRIDQDHSRDWRKICIAVPRLSLKWLDYLWPDGLPKEIQLAGSIASIGACSRYPIIANIFGVEAERGYTSFPKDRPYSAVWSDGPLMDQMIKILRRRLVDADPKDQWPLAGSYPVSLSLAGDFLNEHLDEDEIAQWIPPLSLLDWRNGYPQGKIDAEIPSDALKVLDGFFRPLLTPDLKWDDVEPKLYLPFALRMISLLQQDDVENAIDSASSRIRSLKRIPIVRPIFPSYLGKRLAAALLIPVNRSDVDIMRNRWLF